SGLTWADLINEAQLPFLGSTTSAVVSGLVIAIAVDPRGYIYAVGNKLPLAAQVTELAAPAKVSPPLPFIHLLSLCRVDDAGSGTDPVLGTKFDLESGAVSGPWCPFSSADCCPPCWPRWSPPPASRRCPPTRSACRMAWCRRKSTRAPGGIRGDILERSPRRPRQGHQRLLLNRAGQGTRERGCGKKGEGREREVQRKRGFGA
ncbi:unnamed protein product, partial [Phaeothamnion confervicola]